MSPKISIVVPVYNVKKFIEQCIESIILQTYANLEIILVDDGSTDGSGNICDIWSKKDSRVKVIHKENGGLSDARNAGMTAATGDYIGFVDSDDYIHQDMFRLLYEDIVKNSSDISVCGIELFWSNTTKRSMLTSDFCGVLKPEQAMLSIINEDKLKQPVVNRLYKTALIKHLHFPIGKQHEDVFWSYEALGVSKKVSVFDTPLYFYRQRESSIMNSGFSIKHLDSLEAKIQRNKYVDEHFPELSQQAHLNLWFSCIYLMQMSLRFFDNYTINTAEVIINNAKSRCAKIHFSKVKGCKAKLWWILSKISFKNTCKLRNSFGIGF